MRKGGVEVSSIEVGSTEEHDQQRLSNYLRLSTRL
jgi:hypothetical protein